MGGGQGGGTWTSSVSFSCLAANVYLVCKHQVNIKTSKKANPKAPVCTAQTAAPTAAPTPSPGSIWTQQVDSGARFWSGIASSSDGTVRQVRDEVANAAVTPHTCVPAALRGGGRGVRRLMPALLDDRPHSTQPTETRRRR